MFRKIMQTLGGNPNKREIQQYSSVAEDINRLESAYEQLSDEALLQKTTEYRQRFKEGETLNDILPEAFAAVREASKRTIGLRHFDVQMVGGMTLHNSKIAEMRTGEGKTLVATLALYLNALTERGVHLVTVNDYLARRDARWMGPIYHKLGMTVGVLQMAARTENGQKAFLVDLDKTSPHEDQHQIRLVTRFEAYQADITYGTNSEFGFDYLRDNLTMSMSERVQRSHYYAIVDEVDNILIDEARTPLIISGPASEDVSWYVQMAQVVRQLQPEDYEVNEKDHTVTLTELGEAHVETILNRPLRDPDRPEDINPEQARIWGHLEQALRAQFLYKRNKDYLVQGGKVVIVDEFTGRLMPGRRWSEGLHQAVEAKEGVKVEPENVTYATITLQNYFRMYEKLAGMTGTAATESEEFYKIYKLDVLPIPTNLEFVAQQSGSGLMEVKAKDEQGYEFVYYARREVAGREPIFWKRKDFPDRVYRTEEAKIRAITQEILYYYVLGRPQLVGTTSVEHSERLSDRLQAEPLRRLAQTLLIRKAWQDQHGEQILERAVPELKLLTKSLPELDVSEMRPLARSLGLSMNPEDPINLERLLEVLQLSVEDQPRLLKSLQGGIQHQVLNARKHDEESMIIARAGAFGAVTIATNMAGRGVDIKLGGELPEDVLANVVRVLTRAGYENAFDMNNEQRLQALLTIPLEDYGIYQEAAQAFKQYLEEMARVRALGGLHVVGSERHEARRIDNQLRGRSARQGDPGSSRFYLSLEDELMRLFGGQQAESLYKRLNIDENLPMELGLLGRLVEQSQERVEGSNFDIRKHLLEYDDVLNSQRKRIYGQRDRVFTKEDLSEDVLEMLNNELQGRVPDALKDEEGPWKLLAFLDEIQPPIEYEDIYAPAFSVRLLLDEVQNILNRTTQSTEGLRGALLSIGERTLEAERDHLLRSTRQLMERTEENLERQRQEKQEILDNYLQSLQEPEEDAQPRRPQEIVDELSAQIGIPLRLSVEIIRQLQSGDEKAAQTLRQAVENFLINLTINRLVGALERRLEENLGLRSSQLIDHTWEETGTTLLQAVDTIFEQRQERLFGRQSQVEHELQPQLDRLGSRALEERNILWLLQFMAQGKRLGFDQHTHQRVQRNFSRLNYVFLAARLIESISVQEITQQVLDHLLEAQKLLQQAIGLIEFARFQHNEYILRRLDARIQEQLIEKFGKDLFEEIGDLPLAELNSEEYQNTCDLLGRRAQNENYRQLLLGVISEQWVDYLTKVEALRVSIGLEAYAQRDPLVQYKAKASELFQILMADIRRGVVSKMFTFQSRQRVEISSEGESAEIPSPAATKPIVRQQQQQLQEHKKKRKRH